MNNEKLTTKGLIKELSDLGFKAQLQPSVIYIYFNGIIVARIVESETFSISTDYVEWMVLKEDLKEKAFDLFVRYAKTPLEDREEPKKYYLKHRWMGHKKLKYLELDTQNDEWYLGHKYDTIFVTAKNEFTREEIDEIKEKYNTDLSDFKMIEVEE